MAFIWAPEATTEAIMGRLRRPEPPWSYVSMAKKSILQDARRASKMVSTEAQSRELSSSGALQNGKRLVQWDSTSLIRQSNANWLH